MKILSVSDKQINSRKNIGNSPVNAPAALKTNKTPQFGNANMGAASKVFDFIERGGFFMSFLIVDAVSMVIPRILVGLFRDKDKLGHLNYQAGAEEAGREIFSGPSMNLIPMGIVAAVAAGMPATRLANNSLQALGTKLADVISKNPANKEQMNKKLAEKIYEETFKENLNASDFNKYKSKFVESLTEATKQKPKHLFGKKGEFESASAKFTSLVDEIHSKGKKLNIDVKGLALGVDKNGKTIGSNASEFFTDFHRYSKDIIEKASKEGSKSAKEVVEKLTKSRLGVKTATAIAAFLAVGGFLKVLPRFYQQGNVSPAQLSAQRAEGGSNEN